MDYCTLSLALSLDRLLKNLMKIPSRLFAGTPSFEESSVSALLLSDGRIFQNQRSSSGSPSNHESSEKSCTGE
ncbi:hypothetical protein TNCV_417321 [Trichonephila clavipes]|nr:hypothetical protein TNCV_417321 [Trichonephila clavipes]